MPIYEFFCTTCNHGFEEIMKVSENYVPLCPKCNTDTAVERQLSAVFCRPHGIPTGSGGFMPPKCASKSCGGGSA